MAKRKNLGEVVDLNDVRTLVRKEIEKRYGSVAQFLKTSDIEKFGIKKGNLRCYLYNTGAVNYNVIADLSKFLGIGILSRNLVVTRTYSYTLQKFSDEDKEIEE